MILDAIGQLNWLAIVVAAVVYYAVGAAWFAPVLMGDTWRRASGMQATGTAFRPTPTQIAAPLVAYLFAATATALLAAATGSDSILEGVVLGIVLAMGFAGSVLAATAVFETSKPEPWTWFGVSYGYHAAALIITALIVSLWH